MISGIYNQHDGLWMWIYSYDLICGFVRINHISVLCEDSSPTCVSRPERGNHWPLFFSPELLDFYPDNGELIWVMDYDDNHQVTGDFLGNSTFKWHTISIVLLSISL